MTSLRLSLVICATLFLEAVGGGQIVHGQAIPTTKYRALVMGNSSYSSDRLSGPDNDARDMAKALVGIGFTVVNASSMINLKRDQMVHAMENFMQEVDSDTVAIVYYSGHGVEDNNKNYLVPVDAVLKKYADIDEQLLPLDEILKRLAQREAKTRIVILDACRDLPLALKYTKSFGDKGGLSVVKNLGPGTTIFFATAPNKVAISAMQSQRNSVFTSALLSAIEKKPATFMELFITAAMSTFKMTGEKQSPWISGELQMAAFQLHGAGQHASANPLTQVPALQIGSAPNTGTSLPALGCSEISEQIVVNGIATWRKKCI